MPQMDTDGLGAASGFARRPQPKRALANNAQGHLAFPMTEKNRSGPQRLKFPPSRPNLGLYPNDFSLGITPEALFVRSTYPLTG